MFFFLPYGTDRESRHIPFITYGLIALNCLVFVIQASSDNPKDIVQRFGFVPADAGALSWLTHMFVHEGPMHLGFNMLFLWLFGSAVEGAIGAWLYLPTYLLAGFFAVMLHLIIVRAVDPVAAGIPLIGASGAVSGLLGLFVLRFYQTKIKIWYIAWLLILRMGTFEIGSPWFIGFWIAQQLWSAIVSMMFAEPGTTGVAYWAHIGGFGLGILYALLINFQREGRTEYLIEDAQSAFSSGSYAQAGHLAQDILSREPNHPGARLTRARAMAHTGMLDESVQDYERLLWQYLRQGDYATASDVYLEMLALHPDMVLEVRLHFAAASALAQTGKTLEALTAYLALVRQFPRSQEAQTALLRCAKLYLEQLNNRQDAIRALELFFQRYPGSPSESFARQLLARAKSTSGQ